MVIPTNQNRHLYVVKKYNNTDNPATFAADIAGTISPVKKVGEGNDACIFFSYKGPGGVIKSDYIQLKNLDYVKVIPAWEQVAILKKVRVQVTGTPIENQDYVLRITLRQFHGMSDEDVYIKDAVVHIPSTGMTASTLYTKMKESLDRSFSRELGATATSNPYLRFQADAESLCIYEKPQPWTHGIGKQERVYFEVQPTTIFSGTEDVVWGTAVEELRPRYLTSVDNPNPFNPTHYNNTTNNATTGISVGFGENVSGLPNSRAIADLEWFCAGERGDQYRMVGWPDYIPTTYLIGAEGAASVNGYNVIEIHHAFTDTGVNSYRGEKDITIVAENTSDMNDYMNDFIDTLEEATGLELPTLSPNSD